MCAAAWQSVYIAPPPPFVGSCSLCAASIHPTTLCTAWHSCQHLFEWSATASRLWDGGPKCLLPDVAIPSSGRSWDAQSSVQGTSAKAPRPGQVSDCTALPVPCTAAHERARGTCLSIYICMGLMQGAGLGLFHPRHVVPIFIPPHCCKHAVLFCWFAWLTAVRPGRVSCSCMLPDPWSVNPCCT